MYNAESFLSRKNLIYNGSILGLQLSVVPLALGLGSIFVILAVMKHYYEIITIDPQIRFGKPCIRGMRITVYDILGWLASGMEIPEILEDHPGLTREDITAALAYAADREHKIKFAS